MIKNIYYKPVILTVWERPEGVVKHQTYSIGAFPDNRTSNHGAEVDYTSNKGKLRGDETINHIHMLSHPTRNKIGQILDKADKTECYARKIAKDLGVSRELVAFHLLKMREMSLVESEYILKSGKPSRAVSCYKFTEKGKIIFDDLSKIL